MDDKLPTKTAKFISLENLYVYGMDVVCILYSIMFMHVILIQYVDL